MSMSTQEFFSVEMKTIVVCSNEKKEITVAFFSKVHKLKTNEKCRLIDIGSQFSCSSLITLTLESKPLKVSNLLVDTCIDLV